MSTASRTSTSGPDSGIVIPASFTDLQINEDKNYFSPPTKVLGSLANDQASTKDTWIDNDRDDSPPATPIGRVTRVANRIFRQNSKYALVIAASNIVIPRSPKYAMTILEWQ